ncbi:metal-dependent transcriptional regulator [Lutibacter sp. HS1-25]|uniref:metal-dependent transcriptional regulator n=2 Tax=Lutibacter sp. HS1-25 TaxID=2485000 RepID=UPI0013E98995
MLSQSEENYLKAIFSIELSNAKTVSTTLIAKNLSTKASSVTDMIKKLADKNLVNYEKYKGVKLTSEGKEIALNIVRSHRIWEVFLVDKLNYNWDEVHDLAEQLEHIKSTTLIDKLDKLLGFPKHDPHGDPIPTEAGEIEPINGKPIPNFKEGTIGRIIHIEDEPEIIYKQILAEDLHIGSQLHIVENNEKRVVFHSEGEEYVLAPIVANNITITELLKEEFSEEKSFRLSNLKNGEEAKIIGISRECRGEIRRRLLDLGFVINTKITVDLTSPMNNPRAYLVRDTSIAIRNEQAKFILIEKIKTHAKSH